MFPGALFGRFSEPGVGPAVPLAQQRRGVPDLLEDLLYQSFRTLGIHQDAVHQRIERWEITPLQLDQGRRVTPCHAVYEYRVGHGTGRSKGQGRHSAIKEPDDVPEVTQITNARCTVRYWSH